MTITQLNLIIVMISQNLLLQQAKVEILLFCCRSHFWIFYLKHTILFRYTYIYKFKNYIAFQYSWSTIKMLLIQFKCAQHLLWLLFLLSPLFLGSVKYLRFLADVFDVSNPGLPVLSVKCNNCRSEYYGETNVHLFNLQCHVFGIFCQRNIPNTDKQSSLFKWRP